MLILAITLLAAGQAPETAARNASERAADSRDKVVCKRFLETGSLVRGYRTCKTKAEWERDRDNIRQSPASDSCRSRANGIGC